MELLYAWAFVFAYLMSRQRWMFIKIRKIQDVAFEITKSHRGIITEQEAAKMFVALNGTSFLDLGY
ncbi:MAG: hypothetical protein QQN55_07455 [Nitrosopumilus sp.]